MDLWTEISILLGVLGVGLAIFGFFGTYVWHDMPTYVTTPAVIVGLFLILASLIRILFLLRSKLSVSRLIGFIQDSRLRLRAHLIREWKDPFWDGDEFITPRLLKERDEREEKVKTLRDRISETQSQIRRDMEVAEFNSRMKEATDLERQLETATFFQRLTAGSIESDFVDKLQRGELLARGFLMPHVAGRAPVIIPPHEWALLRLSKDSDRGGSVATGAGVQYIAVMVGRP